MTKNKVITVQNLPITVTTEEQNDYICITDIAAAKSDDSRAADVIKNWMRNRNTLEFLLKKGVTVELMHIKILRLNLLLPLVRYLNCI